MSQNNHKRPPDLRGQQQTGASAPVFFPKKCAVFVDLENLVSQIVLDHSIEDYRRFRKMCLELGGPIEVMFAFLPAYPNLMDRVRELYEHNIQSQLCPKFPGTVGAKDKDKVDYVMERMIRVFADHPAITNFVIVSNDGDFSQLVSFLQDRGKKVFLFKYGKVSRDLISAVGKENTFDFPVVKV